jgi:hypothetical protein
MLFGTLDEDRFRPEIPNQPPAPFLEVAEALPIGNDGGHGAPTRSAHLRLAAFVIGMDHKFVAFMAGFAAEGERWH